MDVDRDYKEFTQLLARLLSSSISQGVEADPPIRVKPKPHERGQQRYLRQPTFSSEVKGVDEPGLAGRRAGMRRAFEPLLIEEIQQEVFAKPELHPSMSADCP